MSERHLPTIAMTPMPEFGYVPMPLIVGGRKVHTLRKCRHHGRKEITVSGKRTGIIIEFHGWVEMRRAEFLTNEFAEADGFRGNLRTPPVVLLMDLLRHFYGVIPRQMWCNHFRLLQCPKEADRETAELANREESNVPF